MFSYIFHLAFCIWYISRYPNI